MFKKINFFLILSVILTVTAISANVELELLTHPQNADLYIDSVWRGNTPISVSLSPGKHLIEIKKEGYQPIQENIDARMPSVIEYNLIPDQKISDKFPMVIYLINYQQSGDRKILFRENENQLVESLKKRFEDMGFSISVEKPIDEFDLVMDNQSIYDMLYERHPQSRLFMIVNALWSYSSFREKKITRLETQIRIYDPQTSITLGNFQDISESLGVLGTQITVLQTVEKATQNFLDHIGNFMVERIKTEGKRPILAFKESDGKENVYVVKSDKTVNNLKLYDENSNPIEFKNPTLDSFPLNIVFLVDRSGSNESDIPRIKAQVDALLKILPEGAQWSLIGFDDKIEIIQGFTNDYTQWKFASDKIVSSGMTRLYDALFNSATILSRKNGLKIVILLTDGIDSDYYDTGLGSIKTEEEALNSIHRAGMVVYPIGISKKNHETLLKRIAHLSTTDFYNANKLSSDEIANLIVRDITFNFSVAATNEKKEPVFSINGYKYQKDPITRFLNPLGFPTTLETAEDLKDTDKVDSLSTESSTLEKKHDVEPEPEPEQEKKTIEAEKKKEDEPAITQEPADEAQKEKQIVQKPKHVESQTSLATVTETKSEESQIIISDEPKESVVSTQTTVKTQDEKPSQDNEKKQVEEPITSANIENIVEYPSEYNQLLNLAEISIYDLDDNGNLIWAQGDILYFYIPEEDRIGGISLNGKLKKISFQYPFVLILIDEKIKTLDIQKDAVKEISSIDFNLPVSSVKMLNEDYLVLSYENGTFQLYKHNLEKINEWQAGSGIINDMVMDESNRFIFSTTTGRVGWIDNINGDLNLLKLDKPVVGLCPFEVDQERFLIVDASGSVYFQRFENIKATIRSLNRGIVLKAHFAESNNMLFANHWDKTIRGYRIFDLNETVLFRSKKGIETFDVDTYSNNLVISTVDSEMFFYSKNHKLPQNLERIYAIEKFQQEEIIEEPQQISQTVEEKVAGQESLKPEADPSPAIDSTEIDLSQADKKETETPSEISKTKSDEKPEPAVAVVLDGKVIIGSIDDKTDTPIPTSARTEEGLTPEELLGFEPIYGGWKKTVAYKDYGFVLAGDANMRIVNPLLQTIKTISYSKGTLLDMDLSKYNILANLFQDRIEIWDIDKLYSTKDISKINSFKFPVTDGNEIKFSRNGEYLLLLKKSGETKMMSIDFTRGKNIAHVNEISAMNTDYSQAERFVFGDKKGIVGFIAINGVVNSKKVSESEITHVFTYKEKTYWVDKNSTVGILGGTQKKISSDLITAVYPAEIDKGWIMFGTNSGTLLIYNNKLEESGKTSIENAVIDLNGYKENMISVDKDFNLKSWNLTAGSAISSKPNFISPYALFSEEAKLSIISQEKAIYTYSPNSDVLDKKKFVDDDFVIGEILKNPVVVQNEGKKYYPYKDGRLGAYSVEAFEEGNVNSSERFFMYWKDDMLSVFDIDNSQTVRTFKFGEGNDIHFASIRNERLFFFFNNSMGITNPYNPGQLVVVDLEKEGLSQIKKVFLVEGTRLGILDSNGKIIYYLILEDRISLPIDLATTIASAGFDKKNSRIIAKSKNEIIIYNALNNDIQRVTFTKDIQDFTFTDNGIYVLTVDGTIWRKLK